LKSKTVKKSIPNRYLDLEQWQTDRRKFLRGALLAGAMTQIGFFTSCSTKLKEGNDLLTAEQATILNDVLNIFFPNDGNGPDAEDINAFGYVMWVLHDTLNRKIEDNAYILVGLNWADETAQEIYFSPFVELSQEQKEALVGKFTELDWGKNWSSMIITLILEALVLDPIYGGNKNEAGWNWLNHTPGFPRPTEENRYERIMEKQMKLVK
jgi:gluconate 2-dehydrogenase gamma chain